MPVNEAEPRRWRRVRPHYPERNNTRVLGKNHIQTLVVGLPFLFMIYGKGVSQFGSCSCSWPHCDFTLAQCVTKSIYIINYKYKEAGTKIYEY